MRDESRTSNWPGGRNAWESTLDQLRLMRWDEPSRLLIVACIGAAAIGVGVLLEVLKYVNKLVWPWFQKKLETEYRVFQYSVALIFLGFLASMLVLAGAEWASRPYRPQKELNA